MNKDNEGNPYAIGKLTGNDKQRTCQIKLSDRVFFELNGIINLVSPKDNGISITRRVKKVSGNGQLGCSIPKEMWDYYPAKTQVRVYLIKNESEN